MESIHENACALHALENMNFDIKEYVRTSKYVFIQINSHLQYVAERAAFRAYPEK